MIRPLRQRHRRTFVVLSVILPVALVVGIVARKPVPTTASLPDALSEQAQEFPIAEWSRDDLFAKVPFHVALVRDGGKVPRFAFEWSAPENFVKPDLLVYWIAGHASVSERIPDEAILLGSFDACRSLPLSRDAAESSGMLILYSLADHEIIDVSKPIAWQRFKELTNP